MKTSDLSCAFFGYIYYESPIFKATLITIAILLLIASLPTFLLNMCIIISIIRRSQLHTPSFIVIINMAISDCLAGCTVYIFFAITCIRLVSGYDPCPVAYVGTPLSYILVVTSFYTITLQTIERYLAIFFPYWYHEKVTIKRIIMAMSIPWLSSIAVVTFWLITRNNSIYHGTVGSLSLTLYFATMICYIRMFKEVRRIEREMMTHQTASYEDRKKIKSESKVAKATLIILVAVVICYSPGLFLHFYVAVSGKKKTSFSIANYWAWLLAMLNSFVNPLIACRQLTVLRRPVIGLLLFIFPCFKRHYVGP